MGIVCLLFLGLPFHISNFQSMKQKLLRGFDWVAMWGQDGFVSIYVPHVSVLGLDSTLQ